MPKTWKEFREDLEKMTPEQKKTFASEIRKNVQKRLAKAQEVGIEEESRLWIKNLY